MITNNNKININSDKTIIAITPPEDKAIFLHKDTDMEGHHFIRPGNFDLYDIKKTQIEMMQDRGYEIPESEKAILNMKRKEFHEYLDNLVNGEFDNEWVPYLENINLPENSKYTRRTLLGGSYKKDNKRCLVIFLDQAGGQQVMKVIIDAIIVMVEGIHTGVKYDELILISNIIFSTVSKSCISDLRFTRHWIFFDRELVNNASKSVLNPEFSILPEKQAREFKRAYKHTAQMSEDDAIVKYYGWKVGSVVLIQRDVTELNMIVKTISTKRVIVRSTAVTNDKKKK